MLKTKEEVNAWLQAMKVDDYQINDDLTVDCEYDVNLRGKGLTELPVQFGSVGGVFAICDNQLTSLRGCPLRVEGSFDCHNNELTSLEGAPRYVGLNFTCTENKLSSLAHGPEEVFAVYDCRKNPLTTYTGFTTKVGSRFDCDPHMFSGQSMSGSDLDCLRRLLIARDELAVARKAPVQKPKAQFQLSM